MLHARPPHPDDAPALAALMTPAVSRNLGRWPVPFSAGMAADKVGQALDAMARGVAVVDVLTLDGAVAGWISGFLQPGTDRAGIGYWLGEPFQGHGLLRALAPGWLDAMRLRLGAGRAWAATQPGNHGSRRVMAACGLRPVRAEWMDTPARGRLEWVEVWERAWSTPIRRVPTYAG